MRLSKKSVALIIVIFAMMLFAMLGWTLAVLISGDFESNLRTLQSERALGLAEAGANWALAELNQDSSWRTTSSADCSAVGSWVTHTLSPGQYSVCSRPPNSGLGEIGSVVVEAEGYVPLKTNYQAMRKLKMTVSIGSLNYVIQTQPPDPLDPQKGLFNWTNAASHIIIVDGTISAGHYEANGNGVYDQLNTDYRSNDQWWLAWWSLPPGFLRGQRVFSGSYPTINMEYFYNNNNHLWPNPSTTQLVDTLAGKAGTTVTAQTNGFFTGMANEAVRLNAASWYDSNNNWAVINSVAGGGKNATLDKAVTWPVGSQIKLVKRFEGNQQGFDRGIWYIGEESAGVGGTTADVIIDCTTKNTNFKDTAIIAEGDIVIKGSNDLDMRFVGVAWTRFPMLGTKEGNIISRDGASLTGRIFDGLIYTENGIADFNYLTGVMIMGKRVYLDGRILLVYVADRVAPNGFDLQPTALGWREE